MGMKCLKVGSLPSKANPYEQEDYKASYSIDKAKQLLNWNPEVSLEMGIRELMNNVVQN
jgi:nucleoside-diphosphate-sugar epimerase